MSDTKLKLLRILEILKESDESSPVTAIQIGNKLKLYGIEAERKSICRDINLLIDYGYDIIMSQDNKQGYFIGNREFEDWELKILIDAVWGAKFLTYDNSKALTDKLIVMASDNSQKLLKAATPIKSHIKNSNGATKVYIDTVLQAIKNGNKISFQYTYTDTSLEKQLKRDGLYYVVNPYSLLWHSEKYYLIGNYEKYDDLSYYRLDLIRNLSITNEKIKESKEILGANPDSKIADFVKTSIYHFGGEKINLTLSCKDFMIDEIVDCFGDDIRIQKLGKGTTITVTVRDGDGLYYWLMQHGSNITVISPQSVKNRLVEFLKDTLRQYE